MTPLTSLKQLQYLVALSEHLNFTRAAEACFVTQSALSAGLRELEEVLGARLVERDRQTVIMTPVGLDVVQRSRALLAAAQDLVEAAGSAQEPMTGVIHLGVIPTIAPFLLPQIVRFLRERFPKLRLALREDLTANLLTRLTEGRIDFALIALPYDTMQLMVAPLFDDALWILGHKSDFAGKAKRVDLSSALVNRLLVLEEGHCLRDHALYACGTRVAQVAHSIEATSLLTLVQMIESGLGVGLVPEMAVKTGFTESPSLVARPLAAPSPKRTIALAARRSTLKRQEFEALADVIRTLGRSNA
jgi:LysR family hydrogen peroxide-inducible transcriptional activator